MRKSKLKLEDLSVTEFVTGEALFRRGTVNGNDGTNPTGAVTGVEAINDCQPAYITDGPEPAPPYTYDYFCSLGATC